MSTSEEKTLEHIIRRMQSDRSVDAPFDVIKYTKNLYHPRAAEPKRSVIRRLLAVMAVDLAPNRPAFGERSAAGAQARRILFESGENAIDLRITAKGNGFDIRGQILGNGFANGELNIIGEQKSFAAKLNELSAFKLASIPKDAYSISIRGEQSELFIESLILT